MSDALLQKNLNALQGRQPVLAKALQELPDTSTRLTPTPDGGFSVQLRPGDGPWVQSRRNPVEEGRRLAASKPRKFLEVSLVLGVGLGYTIRALIREASDNAVIVIEHNLELIRLALSLHDFSDMIGRGHLCFVQELPGQPAGDVLDPLGDALITFGFQQFSHPYTANDDYYTAVMRAFADWLKSANVRIQTRFAGSRHHLRNALDNLCHYLTSSGRGDLKDTCRGMPGVLVGAGPSLQKALPLLKQYNDQLIVVVVSTALKRVLAEGIRVDFTCVVDYSHLSARYFRDLPAWPPLVAMPTAHPHVLDSYRGPLLVDERADIQQLLGPEFPERGGHPRSGTNVSHYAFFLLDDLGCDPIMLVGMDQAFSYHVTHVPGAATYDEASGAASRFTSLYQKDLIFMTARDERVNAGTDLDGNPLITDRQMDESAITFEQAFLRATGKRIMNCTGAGRVLRNCENLRFEDALNQVATRPLDRSRLQDALKRSQLDRDTWLARGDARLQQIADHSVQFQRLLQRANRALQESAARVERSGETGDLQVLNELNTFTEKHKLLQDTVAMLASADLYERRRIKQQSEDPKLNKIDKVRLQLKGEEAYTYALGKAFGDWNEFLERARRRISQARAKGKVDSVAEGEREGEGDTLSAPASSETTRTVDAFIERATDLDTRWAFIGGAAYSPLKIAVEALLQDQRIRQIVVQSVAGEDFGVLGDLRHNSRLRFSELPANLPDIGARDTARKLFQWNTVSTIYAPVMGSYVGLHVNPWPIIASYQGHEPADFVMVVPGDTGFLTAEVVSGCLNDAVANLWQRPLYLYEGPQGLFPTLWEMSSILDVQRDNAPLHMIYFQQEHYWGPSFLHMPSWVRACHRNFSLARQRDREFCAAIASTLGGEPSLRSVIDASEANWQAWTGTLPRDIEIEISTRRSVNPRYWPELTRPATAMAPSLFRSIVEQCASQRDAVNLTLGGFGDALEHSEVVELVRAARPHVQSICVSTFGHRLSVELFEQLREAGMDCLLVRMGAWERDAYKAMHGSDHYQLTGERVMQVASRNVQMRRQHPLVAVQVVKCKEGDRSLVAFRDAFWTPMTHAFVVPVYDFDGQVSVETNVRLRPGIVKPPMRLYEQMLVLADGRVAEGWFDANGERSVGSARETPLPELWRAPALEALRQRFASSTPASDPELWATSLGREWFSLCG